MRKLILFLGVILATSCGTSTNDKKVDDENKTTSTTESTDVSACDQFLDDYEKWADEVIEIYQKVKENPTDMQNTQKMMEATAKMAEWSEEWTKLYDCANNEEYAERVEKIQEKVDNAMN